MKHRTDTLEGALLDAAVAMAEGKAFRLEQSGVIPARCWEAEFPNRWWPSTDWSQGGPILDRERIAVEAHDYRPAAQRWQAMAGEPLSGIELPIPDGMGPTALIAGMRARVRKAFGEEIELP